MPDRYRFSRAVAFAVLAVLMLGYGAVSTYTRQRDEIRILKEVLEGHDDLLCKVATAEDIDRELDRATLDDLYWGQPNPCE